MGTGRFRHAGWVTAVAYSPDGSTLASGGTDGVIHLWDAKSGKDLRVWTTGTSDDAFLSIVFAPDGKTLAAAGAKGVRIWSTSTGQELRSLPVGEGAALAFSPDGLELACQSSDGSVLCWDLATGKESAKFEGPRGTDGAVIPSLSYTPEGTHLAVGGSATVRLVARSSGKGVRPFIGHKGPVTSLELSKDGTLLATTGGDGTIRLWEVASGEEILSLPGPKFPDPASYGVSIYPILVTACLALSPDGKTLAAGGAGLAPVGMGRHSPGRSSAPDRQIHLWNLSSGRDLGVLRIGGTGYWAFAFSPDGKTLAAAKDHSVQLWDVAAREEIPSPSGPRAPVRSIAFSPDGKSLATDSAADSFIRLWDAVSGKEVARLPLDFPTPIPSNLTFAPDGRTFWRTSAPFLVWDLATREQLKIHSRTDPSDWRGGALAFSPDGKSFLVYAGDGVSSKLRIRELQTGKHLKSFTGKEAEPGGLAFSLDGKLCAAGYWDGSVWVWDTNSGQKVWQGQLDPDPPTRELLGRFKDNASVLSTICPRTKVWFWQDGRILMGVWGASLVFWEAATGKMLQRREGAWTGATALTLSADGKTVAAWKEDEVHLWEFSTGGEYLKVPAGRATREHYSNFEEGVGSFAFAPDGKTLAVKSDSTVLVWDLLRPGPGADAASAEELEKAWTRLAVKDAREARGAMEALVRVGDKATEFLAPRLGLSSPLRNEEIESLVGSLASDDIASRDSATSALRERATQAQLRGCLERKTPQETSDRLQEILTEWSRPVPERGPEIRFSRAVEVLERVGTAKARELLDTLVATARLVRQQEDARMAASRLERTRPTR
jgi:WD40 repeat protein